VEEEKAGLKKDPEALRYGEKATLPAAIHPPWDSLQLRRATKIK